MPEQPEELVLCLDAAALMRLFAEKTGRADSVWMPAEAAPIDEWLPGIRKAFLPRSEAEIMSSYRHLATYTLLTCGGKVFTYRRGTSGSEGRLHGKLSIGVGGHVTLDDYRSEDYGDGIEAMPFTAAMRELDEELNFQCGRSWYYEGLIASSASAVDRVHLGSVWRVEIRDDDEQYVSVHEDCLASPKWMTEDELWDAMDDLESWSAIAYREVLKPIGEAPR